MTVEEAQAAVDAAQAVLDAANASGTMKEKIAASKALAAARTQLTAIKNATRLEERAARAETAAAAAAKAEAERPKTGQEMAAQLKGVRPIIGAGESPDVVGGAGFPGYVDYKPIDEAGLRALYGYNPKTGKAYTPEEIKAANAGYLYGEDQGGPVGYELDPRTGQMNVLYKSGMVATSGATYQYTPQGYVVPSDKYMENFPGFGYDDFGRMINAQGQPITQADIDTYNSLVQKDPEAAREFARGKGFSSTVVNSNAPTTSTAQISTAAVNSAKSAAFTTGARTTQAGGLQNPYVPGTAAFTAFQERESAYNLLYQQMAAYGLQSLVDPLRNLVLEGVSPSEFTIRLRDTAAYKQRFGANQARINKGLRALTEAEYIGLEDQYQNVMRQYGLPSSYYSRGDMGRQEGFEKFIAGDVSPAELESRISTAYNRVVNANPEVGIALRNFYPDITNGDILAYALDPERALDQINRKITAAEIGGAAVQAGLTTNESDAAYLARYGITKQQAEQGYRTISGYLPRAQQLSSIYAKQVEGGPYTQASAEREVFGVPGAAEEERKRQRITSLEQAAFSGQAGLSGGALARERAGSF